MSRTTLCLVTAGALATLSIGVSVLRFRALGQEAEVPHGPGTYKVTLRVRGQSTGDARLLITCPPDFHRQHIFGEEYQSDELASKVKGQHGERRSLQWTQRLTASKGPIEARYEFYCTVDVHRPTSSMSHLQKVLHAAPKPGEYVAPSPGIDAIDPSVTRLALELTADKDRPAERVVALYQHVQQSIAKEPSAGSSQTATECLESGRGDALAKSRLLAALCRNRGIPARLVTGLTLGKTNEQKAHIWVEAWMGDYWMPMCPFHNHCGRVPATYLVFGFGDMVLVRGHNLRDLDYACLVEHQAPHAETESAAPVPPLKRFFARISLYALPPAEWRFAEFLLLLPVAALVICVYRNLIGLQSFGTFAPALIGLAFRELESLPGILVFVSILLVGWGMRRWLDNYHLLQVPRTSVMLTLVVLMLIVGLVAANYKNLALTRYISLFPLVILTGMIERFWTMETEDGTWASFKTLLNTLIIAGTISLVVSIPALLRHLVNYPESLGLVMAAQLLIGRYTGYRLMELYRFRDFLNEEAIKG